MELSTLSQQQRRSKQLVPETQKDNSYWQKRHRNNIAAKRSRENKRQYEVMVRGRVMALEEENCILKKELELLKKMLNLPKDASVLGPAERDQCLQEYRNMNNLMNNSTRRHESSSSSVDTSDYSNSPCNLENENTRNETNAETADMHTPVSSFVWAITPAHSQSLQRYAESSKLYRSEMTDGNDEGHTTGCKRKRNISGEDNMMPADLSTKRNPYTDRSDSFKSADDGKYITRQQQDWSMQCSQSYGETRIDCSGPIDLTHDINDNDGINSDIKSKLQLLSDQVERMQKIVCNA